MTTITISDRARALHSRAIVINGNDSTPSERFTPEYLDKLAAGGVTVICLTTVRITTGGNNFQGGVLGILGCETALREMVEGRYLIVKTAEDIRKAKADNKVGVIFGFQDLMPIEDNLDYLPMFYNMGLRLTQLTYNRQNLLGSGCGEPRDSGVSKFGREVIRAINDLGIVLDLSHAGELTAREALELCDTPPIYSHACVKAISGHFRGVSDDLLKMVAERGGVVGIVTLSSFLRRDGGLNGSTIEDYLDHIAYIADKVGIEHAGIGLDQAYGKTVADTVRIAAKFPEFGGHPPLKFRNVTELQPPEDMPVITEGLLRRGYTEEDIRAVLGGNFLRVFDQVLR